MSNEFERLSKIAQDELGVTIKPKHPTGETFESLYGETIYIDRKEKQIEEMAKVIDKSPWKLEQDFTGCNINSSDIAEFLYNSGCRQQSEAVKEIFEVIKAMPKKFTEKSQDFEFGYRIAIQEILAELEKKYTEESENDRQ